MCARTLQEAATREAVEGRAEEQVCVCVFVFVFLFCAWCFENTQRIFTAQGVD